MQRSVVSRERQQLISKRIDDLVSFLGSVRKPFPDYDLRRLFEAGEYTDLVSRIRLAMRLKDLRLVVGFVNSGGPRRAPAWITIPDPMPLYGSSAFRNISLTLFVRKSFLRGWSFEGVVAGIAHELSHALLASLHNPLWKDEVAVDLTAMILGFRDYFLKGTFHVSFQYHPNLLRLYLLSRLGRDPSWSCSRVGYMTLEEYTFAAGVMEKRQKESATEK